VRVDELQQLSMLAPFLRQAVVAVGGAVTVAERLKPLLPRLDVTEVKVKKPKAARPAYRRRYSSITE
jgi:hypothetical protein